MTIWAADAAARVRRFQARGGVLLDSFHRMEIEMGTVETGHRFRFRCPVCGHVMTNDQEMEPMCTGPSWTDDHPYEVMERIAD